MWKKIMERLRIFKSPQELMKAARASKGKSPRGEATTKQSRYTYRDGPMYYLGQQIVEQMRKAGWPSKISECYRAPERQAELKALGRSKAAPWRSPHQFLEAVDIIHETRGWDVPEAYWEALAAAVREVGKRYAVHLEHGHHWRFRDSAHVELKDWRKVRDEFKTRPPHPRELWARFIEVLPKVAKDARKRGVAPRFDA